MLPIYVEATAEGTEGRLINSLRKHCPELPVTAKLPELIAILRRNGGSGDRKVAIILDQFEQWLHTRDSSGDDELTRALRQCDGGHVQCVVMVRDDFWMSATRFMQELEIPLVEGHNSAAVDLFGIRHAIKVLAAFGRAYGQLPAAPFQLNEAQSRFLQQAVEGLAEESKVICIRLAIFAEMMKERDWTEKSLTAVGGLNGIGLTYLEETFSARSAKPAHRLHQEAVRAVLRELLPETGTDIKGQMKSRQQLLEASGYTQRPGDFDTLLRILDSEVRLLTPSLPNNSLSPTEDRRSARSLPFSVGTDTESAAKEETVKDLDTTSHAGISPSVQAGAEFPSANALGVETDRGERLYQLTHDFLVPSLREWLTRKQKETRQGQAELALADRAAVWQARSENRQLPSLLEWWQIRRFTQSNRWTAPQRMMMTKAARVHGTRAVVTFGILMLASLLIYGTYGWQQSNGALQTLLNSAPQSVSAAADKAAAFRFWNEAKLRSVVAEEAETRDALRRQRNARLALLPFDASQVNPLLEDALTTRDTEYVKIIRQALLDAEAPIEEECWTRFRNDERSATERFRAGVMLAGVAPESNQWTEPDFQLLVDELAALNTIEQPQFWPLLKPVGTRMLPPLESLFRNRQRPESDQLAAANAIAYFAPSNSERLARLLMAASGPQYNILYDRYRDIADERTISQWIELTQKQPTADLEAKERIALGKERATAAITLLRQGKTEPVWNVLRYVDDPEALTQFVHGCRARGVRPFELIQLLNQADLARGDLDNERRKDNDSVMYGLLLALGEFAWEELPSERQKLVGRLESIYEKDPSSGVHSATGWLLRQWGHQDAVERLDQRRVPYDTTGHREWFVREIEYEPGGKLLDAKEKMYLTFVVFEPATFTMGSREKDPLLPDVIEPQHQVTLTRPIAICDRELTWKQWASMEGTERQEYWAEQYSKNWGDKYPVCNVSWFNAINYCRWLSSQVNLSEEEQYYGLLSSPPKDGEGHLTDWPLRLNGTGFRLPTEAEWEYACRGGTVTAYTFGQDEQLMDRYAWFEQNSGAWSHATGELRPTPRGLFDIHGNVIEWCHDWYKDELLSDEMDPKGPDSGSMRVARGGCWELHPRYCRSSYRLGLGPLGSTNSQGFRVAVDPTIPVRTAEPANEDNTDKR